MLWNKQLYYFNVSEWLDGDTIATAAAGKLASTAATAAGVTFRAADIMSMPDKWEYPGSPVGTSPFIASRIR